MQSVKLTVRQGVLLFCLLACSGCHKGSGAENSVSAAASTSQDNHIPERDTVIDEDTALAVTGEAFEVCTPENITSGEQGDDLTGCRAQEEKVISPERLSENRGLQCRRLASCCPLLRDTLLHEGRHQGIEDAVNACMISANRTTESDCERRKRRLLDRVTYYGLTIPEGCE